MNPHQVLGVAANATPNDIKAAYRKLAKEHHPDRNGGTDAAARKFQEIQQAYDMLRQDKKPQQEQPQQQHHHHQNFHHFQFDIDQMFEHMQRNMGNPTMQAQCEITLEQAFKGCTIDFDVNGKKVSASIPAGVGHGQQVRLRGAAGQPNPNHPPGDLVVFVMIRQHEIFHRIGMTLLTQIDIDLIDMLTGCEVEIPLVEGGKARMKILPNSNPDSTYSLSGKGMPAPNAKTRGDLHVKLNPTFRNFSQEHLDTLRTLKP